MYRKDEATGAFKEHSKTVFEPKVGGEGPISIGSKPAGSIGFAPPRPSPLNPDAARHQLAQALEALRNNSQKLESKLEKIETLPTSLGAPEDHVVVVASSDVSPVEVKPGLDHIADDAKRFKHRILPPDVRVLV